MKQAKIIVYVKGGSIQEVRSNGIPVDVKVFDVDNLQEDLSTELINDEWKKKKRKYPQEILV